MAHTKNGFMINVLSGITVIWLGGFFPSFQMALMLIRDGLRNGIYYMTWVSLEYLSFSNKRKTTILFPSPLTFL